jgi:hypothetical protein
MTKDNIQLVELYLTYDFIDFLDELHSAKRLSLKELDLYVKWYIDSGEDNDVKLSILDKLGLSIQLFNGYTEEC